MAIRPCMSYTTSATSLRRKTENIITFAQFEEGYLLSETRDDPECGDKFDDDPIMPSSISEEKMDVMDSGDEYRYEPMTK